MVLFYFFFYLILFFLLLLLICFPASSNFCTGRGRVGAAPAAPPGVTPALPPWFLRVPFPARPLGCAPGKGIPWLGIAALAAGAGGPLPGPVLVCSRAGTGLSPHCSARWDGHAAGGAHACPCLYFPGQPPQCPRARRQGQRRGGEGSRSRAVPVSPGQRQTEGPGQAGLSRAGAGCARLAGPWQCPLDPPVLGLCAPRDAGGSGSAPRAPRPHAGVPLPVPARPGALPSSLGTLWVTSCCSQPRGVPSTAPAAEGVPTSPAPIPRAEPCPSPGAEPCPPLQLLQEHPPAPGLQGSPQTPSHPTGAPSPGSLSPPSHTSLGVGGGCCRGRGGCTLGEEEEEEAESPRGLALCQSNIFVS